MNRLFAVHNIVTLFVVLDVIHNVAHNIVTIFVTHNVMHTVIHISKL